MSELLVSIVTFLRSLNEFSGAISVFLLLAVIVLAFVIPAKIAKVQEKLPIYYKRFKIIGLIAQIMIFFSKEKNPLSLPLKMPSNIVIRDEIGCLFTWVEVKRSFSNTFAAINLAAPWDIDRPREQKRMLDKNIRLLRKALSDDASLLAEVDGVFTKNTAALVRRLVSAYQKYVISLILLYKRYTLEICDTNTQDFVDNKTKDLYASLNGEVLKNANKVASARARLELEKNRVANTPQTASELRIKELRGMI